MVSATQTGALIAHVGLVLYIYIDIVTKWCETHPNMSFGSNGVDWMRSLQKKLSRGYGDTNQCINSTCTTHFAHMYRHSNEMVQNTPKHEFWVYWCGLDAFVARNAIVVSATQIGALIAHVGPILHIRICQ